MMSSSDKVIGTISEGLNEGDFDWMINICSYNILEPFDPVKSPTFSFGSSPWHVLMKDYDSFGESKGDYISLCLYNDINLKIKKCFSLSFKMIFLDMEVKKEDECVFYCEKYDHWGWAKYICKTQLINHWTNASKKSCQLIIRIELRDHVPPNEDAFLRTRLKRKDILSQNFKDMLQDGEDHDLVLKVKNKAFKAHRIIMKSRCPVFKSMLTHETLEKCSGVVDIPDCDPAAFELFLLYIYTGELDALDESTMLGLYFIADKYDIENLREECCAFIKKSLSVKNVCDVIKLALDHSDSALLEFATKYFVRNAKDIFVTVEWMSFMKENTVQANELIIKTVGKSSDCCVLRKKVDLNALHL